MLQYNLPKLSTCLGILWSDRGCIGLKNLRAFARDVQAEVEARVYPYCSFTAIALAA